MAFDFAKHSPKTLEEAIDVIVPALNDEERHYVEGMGAESLHFSAGMKMRNEWIHPKDAPLTKHFIDRFGPLHADDMSGMILEGITAKIRGLPYDVNARAQYYREYWEDKGINPVTGEKA